MIKSNKSARRAAYVCTAFTAIVIITNIVGRLATGVCPAYQPLDSFDVEAYTGVWYELENDNNFGDIDCVTAQYELRDG